ncbi:NAD-dependent dihydropyrimidine dehydrogenase PreA subunit [Desulfitispora alkaliphila]|uniref:ATP-binding protein n=1 Tax=Desulfitispora alkaliphila TaxID=622674 RepID=UPI003D227986
MEMRKIVHIDEDKCDGCGLCVPSCHEGAIQIVDGKAQIIADKLCDGLGDCLGECPKDALKIIEREAPAFDEDAVKEHLKTFDPNKAVQGEKKAPIAPVRGHGGGCPGSRAISLKQDTPDSTQGTAVDAGDVNISIKPQLGQWPVQLKLLPPGAPYFANADLLIAADCVPFAYPNFHLDMLKGKAVGIGCPKLDGTSEYVDKIANIIKQNNLKSITVAIMEVPCCQGLKMAVEEAARQAGSSIQVKTQVVGVDGKKK